MKRPTIFLVPFLASVIAIFGDAPTTPARYAIPVANSGAQLIADRMPPPSSAGFLIPPAGQTLYTGTKYMFLGQVQRASAVTLQDQVSIAADCGYDNFSGLVTCTYVPSVAGTLTMTVDAKFAHEHDYTSSRQFRVVRPT